MKLFYRIVSNADKNLKVFFFSLLMSLVKAVQGKEKFYSWAIVICDATTLAFFLRSMSIKSSWWLFYISNNKGRKCQDVCKQTKIH